MTSAALDMHPIDAEPVAKLRGVVKRFRTGASTITAVDGVSLTLLKHDRLAVIGESGSGKSTIARLLLGIMLPDAGSVHVLGHNWAKLGDRQTRGLRAHLGAVFQEPIESLNPRMRVREIIAEPLIVHHRALTRQDVRDRVSSALQKVRLTPSISDRYPSALSGGQAQRVSIARALIGAPRLLVFDEPTSALDVSVQAQILTLLEGLSAEQQSAWVFITHDLAVAAEVCSRAIVVFRGRIVEEGNVRDLIEKPQHPYTKHLVTAVLPLPVAKGASV